jgi:hypothetical protein
LLDRVSSNYDDIWSKLDFTIFDNEKSLDTHEQSNSTSNDTCKILNQPAINSVNLLEMSNNNNSNNNNNNSNWSSKPSLNEHFNNNIVIKSENSKSITDASDDNKLIKVTSTSLSSLSSRLEKSSSVTSSDGQKLDDFEQLLDNANASSNIINKNLVCKKSNDISNDGLFHNATKAIVNNLSSSEILNKNVSVLNSSLNNPDTTSICVSSSSTNFDSNNSNTNHKVGSDVEMTLSSTCVEIASTSSIAATTTTNNENLNSFNSEQDIYKDLMEEIRDDWLHFRPATPEMDDFIFDSDVINDTKKFNVELQLLEDSNKNETENITTITTPPTNCIDNTYLTQPMTFNCHNNSLDIHTNSLYDTSNLTNATTTTTTTNTVNIKTEPIERDFEYSNEQATTSSSSSSLLLSHTKDGEIYNLTADDEKYLNDNKLISSMLNNVDFSDLLVCKSNYQLGCSNFKLFNETIKQPLSNQLENMSSDSSVANSNSNNVVLKTENDIVDNDIQSISSSSTNVTQPTSIVIREAPIAELQSHNYVLQYGSPVSSNSEMSNNATKYVNSSINNTTITNSANLIQQQFVTTGNSLISSSTSSPQQQQQQQQQKMQSFVYDNNAYVLTTTSAKKQMNGPADRNCMLK